MARVLIAPNSFKGTLSARSAAHAIQRGFRAPGIVTELFPISDGGDGMLDVLLGGTEAVTLCEVHDALGRLHRAPIGWREPGSAVIELAAACGLAGISPTDATSRSATSYGFGELIRAAVKAGATEIVCGIGGSASTDGGLGMLEALGMSVNGSVSGFEPADVLSDRWTALDIAPAATLLAGIGLKVAVDVASPLLGPNGAASRFGPQKGASSDTVAALEERLSRSAHVLDPQRTLWKLPGSGAAGGCGFGLAALGATLSPGAAFVLDELGFDAALSAADCVITGEGTLDATTLRGKGPGEVLRRASARGIPCFAVCGRSELAYSPFAAILPLDRVCPDIDPKAHPRYSLQKAGEQLCAAISSVPGTLA